MILMNFSRFSFEELNTLYNDNHPEFAWVVLALIFSLMLLLTLEHPEGVSPQFLAINYQCLSLNACSNYIACMSHCLNTVALSVF